MPTRTKAATSPPSGTRSRSCPGARSRSCARRRRDELYGRAGQSFTARYPEIVGALRTLPLDRFVLDGEVVALDERGRPSFQRLQSRMHLTRAVDVERARAITPVTAVFFDALALDG